MVVVEQGLGLPAELSGRTAVLIDFFDPLREVAGTVEAAGVVEGEFRGGILVGERGEEGSGGSGGAGGGGEGSSAAADGSFRPETRPGMSHWFCIGNRVREVLTFFVIFFLLFSS